MALLYKSPFKGNASHAYDAGYVKRRISIVSEKNAWLIADHARTNYMPEVSGSTKNSTSVDQLSGGSNRWVATSLNYTENELNPSNPYPSTGRYGFKKSRNPYNADKYEWFTRSFKDQRAGLLKNAPEVRK